MGAMAASNTIVAPEMALSQSRVVAGGGHLACSSSMMQLACSCLPQQALAWSCMHQTCVKRAQSAITCSLAATAIVVCDLQQPSRDTCVQSALWCGCCGAGPAIHLPAASLLLLVMGHAEHIQMQHDDTLGVIADGQVLDTVMPPPAVQLRWKQRESRRQKQHPGAPEPTHCWTQPWWSWQ
jgi:hypothetical protein